MAQAKAEKIEGRVDKRAEMMNGILERDFGTGDLASYCQAFSGTEVPGNISMSSGSRSNHTVRPAQREIVQSPQPECETIIPPPSSDLNKSPANQLQICDVKTQRRYLNGFNRLLFTAFISPHVSIDRELREAFPMDMVVDIV
jgi:hypothetical protein